MTTLPEVSSTERYDVVTVNENFQSVSPAAAFGIDWENTAALTVGVFGGVLPDASTVAPTTKTLTASQTNYVERTAAGVVSVNTSAYTSGLIPLFRLVTNANGITSYTDDRSFSPGGTSVIGPTSATDNAVMRFDGTTGKLAQNSVVTISDTGAIAGATSLTITQGTITDPANAFTVTSTWNDAADTFVGASIDITDTASAAASLLQRWRVGGADMASISKAGLVTAAGASLLGATPSAATAIGLNSSGTFTTALGAFSDLAYTFASSVTSTQYGIHLNPTLTPAGGALTNIFNLRSRLLLSTMVSNVTNIYSLSAQVVTLSGYTATTTTAASIRAEAPSVQGTNPITNFSGFLGEAIANGNGATSGTITNYGIQIKAITAAAGSGGTLVNYGGHFTLPSGSNAANTNYGLRVTGNGGAASTNWALYCDSTANSAFAGNVRIGSTTAPTVALDVTGAAAISTNLNVTGVTGLGVASSSTTALIVPASTTGVSSLRVPHGAAPSAPVNGDVWTTTAGIFVRINGATVGPLS